MPLVAPAGVWVTNIKINIRTVPATAASSYPVFDFTPGMSGIGIGGYPGAGMQPWAPDIAQISAAPAASGSTFEQDVNGDLMPIASPVTRGLFEVDANGDIMPATVQLTDTFFETDENGDIEPKV